MSTENRKFRKFIKVNFAILVLLLVSGGFTLSACQNIQLLKSPTKVNQENQSGKSESRKSLINLKKNHSEKSEQQNTKAKDDGLDTPDDDDPE